MYACTRQRSTAYQLPAPTSPTSETRAINSTAFVCQRRPSAANVLSRRAPTVVCTTDSCHIPATIERMQRICSLRALSVSLNQMKTENPRHSAFTLSLQTFRWRLINASRLSAIGGIITLRRDSYECARPRCRQHRFTGSAENCLPFST